MVNATPRPLYRRERDAVHIVQEAWWATGPVWTGAENLVPIGILAPARPACSESLYRPKLYTLIMYTYAYSSTNYCKGE